MLATIYMKNGNSYNISNAQSLFSTLFMDADSFRKHVPEGVPTWGSKVREGRLYTVKTRDIGRWVTFDHSDVSHIAWDLEDGEYNIGDNVRAHNYYYDAAKPFHEFDNEGSFKQK